MSTFLDTKFFICFGEDTAVLILFFTRVTKTANLCIKSVIDSGRFFNSSVANLIRTSLGISGFLALSSIHQNDQYAQKPNVLLSPSGPFGHDLAIFVY